VLFIGKYIPSALQQVSTSKCIAYKIMQKAIKFSRNFCLHCKKMISAAVTENSTMEHNLDHCKSAAETNEMNNPSWMQSIVITPMSPSSAAYFWSLPSTGTNATQAECSLEASVTSADFSQPHSKLMGTTVPTSVEQTYPLTYGSRPKRIRNGARNVEVSGHRCSESNCLVSFTSILA
jgi:hypothetical protein